MRKLLILMVYFIPLGATHELTGENNQNDTLKIRSFRGVLPVRSSGANNLEDYLNLDLEDPNNDHYFNGVLSTRIIPAVYSVALIIGLPSNGVILGALIGKIKTSSAAVLHTSLMTSNILVLLSLTFKIYYHLNGNDWEFGEGACKLVTACFYGNIYCSMHMHMCVGFMRYVATVRPFDYKSMPKRLCTVLAAAVVWTMLLLAMAPELVVQQTYDISELKITTCHDVLPSANINSQFYYKMAQICLGYFIPLLVTVFSYVTIVHRLHKSHWDWIYYIKISTLVFAIFIICFTPSNLFLFVHYINQYRGRQEHMYVYHNVALCLCSLHCCFDPFLFLLLSRATKQTSYLIPDTGKSASLSA